MTPAEATRHIHIWGQNITGIKTKHNFKLPKPADFKHLLPDLPLLDKHTRSKAGPSLSVLHLSLPYHPCSSITLHKIHRNLIWLPFRWEPPFTLRMFSHTLLCDPLHTRTPISACLPVLYTSLLSLGRHIFYRLLILSSLLALIVRKDTVKGIVSISIHLWIQTSAKNMHNPCRVISLLSQSLLKSICLRDPVQWKGKDIALRSDRTGFQPQGLPATLAVWYWASFSASMNCSLFTCKWWQCHSPSKIVRIEWSLFSNSSCMVAGV